MGKIPKDLSDNELEALRYATMKQALILVALIFVVGAITPVILGSLRVTSTVIGIVGVIDYILILSFFIHSRRVARATAKPISGVERQALSKVWWGAFWLILIPVGGSVGSQFGVYFQTNPMHPIYYALAGIGILLTLQGVTSLKERYSYYSVFQFGVGLLLTHPLPALFPFLGPVFVNSFWFATTFLFLAAGFVGMAFALRKMRAGQYEALERAVSTGQKALESRQFDKALSQFDRAVTIAHSIYADKLFKSRASGKGIPADYYVPWIGKATALALSGRGSKALAILDLILEVDPGNADLWSNKGDVLLAMNRPAEAYIAFEQAQRINPSQPSVAPKKQRALDLIQRRMG